MVLGKSNFTKIKQRDCLLRSSQDASQLENQKENPCCVIYIHMKYKDKPKAHSLPFFFFLLGFSLGVVFPYISFFTRVFDIMKHYESPLPNLRFLWINFLFLFVCITEFVKMLSSFSKCFRKKSPLGKKKYYLKI